MHELEQETAAAVQTSQRLQRQRANLVATLDALRASSARCTSRASRADRPSRTNEARAR